jgi:hypothetical protein
MNPIWAFFFKDKYRTPLSVYKMSLSELIVLGALCFGIGFGVTKGISTLMSLGAASPDVVAE